MPTTFDVVLGNRLEEVDTLRRRIDRFGQAHGFSSTCIARLQLVCEEVLVNIVAYAFDDDREHNVRFSFALVDRNLRVTVEDDGKPFSPLEVPYPDLEASLEDRAVGGLGIHFVKTFVDDVEYERADGRNRLTLARSLGPDDFRP